MYNISLFISKEKLLAWIALISLAVIVIMYFISGFYVNRAKEIASYKIHNTDKERRKFIESYGFKLQAVKFVKNHVTIPETFDEVFSAYESVQKEMGLSLIPYRTLTLTKYTYEAERDGKTLYINLFIYKDQIAACDVTNPDFDNGFVKSFVDPSFFE